MAAFSLFESLKWKSPPYIRSAINLCQECLTEHPPRTNIEPKINMTYVPES